MFPSQGFFCSINCPDYSEGKCLRIYCHFNHARKFQYIKQKEASSSQFSEVNCFPASEKTTMCPNSEQHRKVYLLENIITTQAASANILSTPSGKTASNEDVLLNTNLDEPAKSCKSTRPESPCLDDSSSSQVADIDGKTNKSTESTANILENLISEAVKKVLAENSHLNSMFTDPNTIVNSLDTNSLISKAVKEVSGSGSLPDIKEKKIPRLYLPPPGTPSYKPTPISQLQDKNSKVNPYTNISSNEEYTPTSVNIASLNEEPVTDFSSDDVTDDNEAKSEFDMLEEVLVESSSNPSRKRAILKRKKALGKLASTCINSKSRVFNKIHDPKDDKKDEVIENKPTQSVVSDTFHPPSPIFTSSSESNAYTSADITVKNISTEAVTNNCNNESRQDNATGIEEEAANNIPPVLKIPLSTSSTHNLLPQIAHLSRPNVKSWSPVAKVDSLLSVEKMLEQLDSLPDEKRRLLQDNLNRPEVCENRSKVCEKTMTENQQNLLLGNTQPVQDFELEKSKGVADVESSHGKDSDKEKTTRDKKRSYESDDTSFRETKKKKKVHISRKKKKYRSASPSSLEDSFSSDSESEEVSSRERSSKRRKKRSESRNRKHKSKKKRNKHKKKNSKRSRSKSSHRKSSRRCSSSTSRSNSTSSLAKSPLQSQSTIEGFDHVLLDESQIKKEKVEPDLSIVKIEKVSPKHEEKTNMLEKVNDPNNQNTSSEDRLNASTKDRLNASTEDRLKASTEVRLKSSTEDRLKTSTENRLKSSTENRLKSFAEDRKESSTEDRKESSTEDRMESSTEDRMKSSTEYRMKSSTEDRMKSSTEYRMKSTEYKLKSSSEYKLKSSRKSSTEDRLKSSTEDRLKSSTEDRLKSSTEDQLKSCTEDRLKSSTKDGMKSFTEDKLNMVPFHSSQNSSKELAVSESLPSLSITKHSDYKQNNNDTTLISSLAVEKKTQSSSASHANKSTNKPKILKEFSIFDSLTHDETTKKTMHKNSSRKDTKLGKHKENWKTSKKDSQDTSDKMLKDSSHSTKSKSRDYKKGDEDQVQISSKKHHISHSSETSKNKESKRHSHRSSSKDSALPSHKLLMKEDEKREKSSTSSKNKSGSSSNTKSKSSKIELKGNSEYEHIKKYENCHNDASKKKKERKSCEIKDKKREENLPSKEIEILGSDSPIPDLSALDEIPKEDWDQLLAGSGNNHLTTASDSNSDNEVDYHPDSFDASMDTDDANDPMVLEECRKVFSEYAPKVCSQPAVYKKELSKSTQSNDELAVVPTRKSRVAYSGASGNLVAKPKVLAKPLKRSPAEVMLERYKKLKEEESRLRQKLDFQCKELAKHGKVLPSLAISSPAISSTSDAQSTVSSSAQSLSKKRIARAPSNVSALLKSKEKLISSTPAQVPRTASAAKDELKTIAMTSVKGQKRVAHVPKIETLERPIVSTEAGTKVPQNTRQRYLDYFIDETLKFCDGEEHAFNVALAEESICHKRATTRMVYLNLAVNVLKRLRTHQISQAAQELLETDPKYNSSKGRAVSSPCIVSSSSSSSSPAPKKPFQHPVNLNHSTVSHFSVMSMGGQKGTWSIQKSKRALPINIKDYLTGSKFYNLLKKYIMSEEQLELNGFPSADPCKKGKAIIKKPNNRKKVSPSEVERYCDRCSMLYEVDQWGLPVIPTSCVYHWGRAYKSRGATGFESRYSCCSGDTQSEGCCLATTHVSENFSPNTLKGYVRTIPKEPDSQGDFGVFALDCEMCYTTAGNELCRITVVDSKCNSVYETLVKPDNPIIDYNTRFSGITESVLEGVTTSLRDVQAALLTRFSEKTILVGHSLESDFSALKLIHETVVDTSVVFPHKLGPPLKRALRNLASEYLTKIIQNDEGGHDSAEDAISCMELLHWKIKEDLKGFG